MDKLKRWAGLTYDWCIGLIQGNPEKAFWTWLLSLAVVWFVF